MSSFVMPETWNQCISQIVYSIVSIVICIFNTITFVIGSDSFHHLNVEILAFHKGFCLPR